MKKKTIGNKIMVVMMTLMLLLTGLGASKNVFAANTADVDWSFNLSVDSSKFHYVKGRKKENDSKIYINWQNAYGGNLSKLTVSPFGAVSKKGTAEPAGTRYKGQRNYIMNGCNKYSVTNYVYELGYAYARPGIKANEGKGTAKGVWSPDCAGSYKVLQ